MVGFWMQQLDELCTYSIRVWGKLDEKCFGFSKILHSYRTASIFRMWASCFERVFKICIHIGGSKLGIHTLLWCISLCTCAQCLQQLDAHLIDGYCEGLSILLLSNVGDEIL